MNLGRDFCIQCVYALSSNNQTEEGLAVFWFKGCPKCAGDIYLDRDMYGSYAACLQCGHYLSEVEQGQMPSGQQVRKLS